MNSAQNKWKTAAGGEIYPDFKDEESGLRRKFYVSGESVTARNEPRDSGDQTSGDEDTTRPSRTSYTTVFTYPHQTVGESDDIQCKQYCG